jgi:hypothetical protein
MRSYAVTWRESDGLPYSGKLQLEDAQVRLDGSSSGQTASECLRYADITSVQLGRRPQERIGGRPVLTLCRRNGAPLRITSLTAIGSLLEVESRIRKRTSVAHEALADDGE